MRAFSKVVAAGLLCGLTLAPVGAAWGEGNGARVNINTASAAELERLPGIGASKAQAIIEHRAKEPFTRADDLRKVKGIGDKLYESIRDQVTVGEGASKRHGG
jgi:competence protein ComEA